MATKNKQTAKKTVKTVERVPTTFDDFKSAALLVSVTINVAVFVGWLALKITATYDAQVASFLFER